MTEPDPAHFDQPATIEELVSRLRRSGVKQARVRGSVHSVPYAVYTDGFIPGDGSNLPEALDLWLGKLGGVSIWRMQDPRAASVTIDVVTVGGGVYLGPEPIASPHPSPMRINLCQELEKQGYALPVLGGITHQTVAGFMSTGSAGASVQHSFGNAIMSFSILRADGQVRTLTRSPDNATASVKAANEFYMAGVSMGLYGIILEVTLLIVPRYDIVGTVKVQPVQQCDIDLFGDGTGGIALAEYFRTTEYARLLWWPQMGINLVQIWECRRGNRGSLPPHRQFEDPLIEQTLVNYVYQHLLPCIMAETWDRAFEVLELIKRRIAELMRTGQDDDARTMELAQALELVAQLLSAGAYGQLGKLEIYERLVAGVIKLFMKERTDDFGDSWCEGIPCDNQVFDKLIPIAFTELWAPLDQSQQIMAALREYYDACDAWQRGSFCVEIYAAPSSDFWMSPAYGTDVIRIDIFVVQSGPEWDFLGEFYEPLWQLLSRFGARFHWGKQLSPPGSSTGVAYRHGVMPRLGDFLRRRRDWDPNDLFLTGYWSRHLIPPVPPASVTAA